MKFKKLMVFTAIAVMSVSLLSACGDKESGDNSKAAEGQNLSTVENGNLPDGLPDGFPSTVPFYENAEIIEADFYGEDGYTVVYSVNDSYENVVGFYMTNIDGMDESGIGDEEAYFEAVDIGKVHIKGLTIAAAGDQTQVYITLRDDSKGASASEESNEEEYYEEDEADEGSSAEMSYDAASEVELDSRYPSDIVPIYPDAKVIDCSIAPSGSGFVELILPSGAYKDAVSFYKDQLGLKPKNSDSQMMKSELFKGDINGWHVSLQVAQLNADGNDPMVSITVDNRN